MRIFLMLVGFVIFGIGVYDVVCPPTPEPTPVVTEVVPTDIPTVVPTDTDVPATATVVQPTATSESTPTVQFTETITPVISTAVYTSTVSTATAGSPEEKGNNATPTPNLVMPNTGPFDEYPYMGYLFMLVGGVAMIIGARLTRNDGRLL